MTRSTSDAPASLDLETGATLALADLPGAHPAGVCRLLERAGHPLEALRAAPSAPELPKEARHAAKAVRDRIETVVAESAAAARRELAPGDRLVRYGGPGYPHRLRRLHAPPPVLWVRGPLALEAFRTVAVVGTRAATTAGRRRARNFAAELAERGVRVVSGLARGIDAAAHRGSLDVDGETVAVLGSGLGSRYPRENHDLYDRLAVDGLILSEFEPSIPPMPYNFPRRNRIVAALCDAVVVVEAGRKSGALITVDRALELGIEACAFPGDPDSPASAGCHDMLRDGAALVTCAAELLNELCWDGGSEDSRGRDDRPASTTSGAAVAASGRCDSVAQSLLERLRREPTPLDELATVAGSVRDAATRLARLEIAGEVERLPGGRYRRIDPSERRRVARRERER